MSMDELKLIMAVTSLSTMEKLPRCRIFSALLPPFSLRVTAKTKVPSLAKQASSPRVQVALKFATDPSWVKEGCAGAAMAWGQK